MEGVLLVNKPKGLSSFDVVKKIRSLSGVKKVGHAGTLDPLADGLLIVCLGKYTKLVNFLMSDKKTYKTKIMLGVSTTTDDGEGEIVSRKGLGSLGEHDIKKVISNLIGKIQQRPPIYSAIKVGGKRAYELARAGKEVSIDKREVEIFSIEIIKCSLPSFELLINCSKGTYIRSVARDLGGALFVGAFCEEITRLQSGSFSLVRSVAFSELSAETIDENLLTGVDAIPDMKKIEISSEIAQDIRHGKKVVVDSGNYRGEFVATLNHEIIAVLNNSNCLTEIIRVF